MFIKVHPQSLPQKSKVRPGFPNKSQYSKAGDNHTHQKTHPANLQHKAIHFRRLMDLTIAVEREFTTSTKAQQSGGATL